MNSIDRVCYNDIPFFWDGVFRTSIIKINFIFEFFLYSSIFLFFAAAGMAYTCCFIQGIPCTLPVVAILACVVFSIYNMNRKTDEVEDALNHNKRYQITSRFGNILFIASFLSYSVALLFAVRGGLLTVLISFVPLLAGILYSVPILPRSWRYHRLKEIPVIKNIVVSGAWALSFSLIPVLMNGLTPDIVTFLVFTFIFSWTIIGSVLPDIRDREGDAAAGIRTIPVIIGVRKTKLALTVSNLLVSGYFLATGRIYLSVAAVIIMAVSVVYSQACILIIGNIRSDNILVDIISDGQFLVIGIVVYMFVLFLSYHH
jgi:4-hydroxybenzoate polyprenyltransferase